MNTMNIASRTVVSWGHRRIVRRWLATALTAVACFVAGAPLAHSQAAEPYSEAAKSAGDTLDLANGRPTANAGADTTGTVTRPVTLNGSLSSDPETPTTQLQFHWSLLAMPAGSHLSDDSFSPNDTTAAIQTSLQPDRKGSYTIGLIVGDGTAISRLVTVQLNVVNSPPAAVFTAPTTGTVGVAVTLVATASSDVNVEDTLTYRWSFVSVPAGSFLAASDIRPAGSPNASFAPDQSGAYRVQLVVNDGTADSRPATADVAISAPPPTPPVARAVAFPLTGGPRFVHLDGRGSIGTSLTYQWSLASAPHGAGPLASAAPELDYEARPPGNYQFSLTVTGAGQLTNTTSVAIAVDDITPTASAGPDRSIILPRSDFTDATGLELASSLSLDGRGSVDANGQTLTYQWSFVSVPDRSAASADSTTVATFSDRTAATPTLSFRTDLVASPAGQRLVAAGSYRIRLTVSDGNLSGFAEATIEVNDPVLIVPAANAGIDATYRVQIVSAGVIAPTVPDPTVVPASDNAGRPLNLRSFIRLDGHESADPRGRVLSYSWAVARDDSGALLVPAGSAVSSVSGPSSAAPTFVPDREGSYTFELTVSNGGYRSRPVRVTIRVLVQGHPPTAEASVRNQQGSRRATAQDPQLSFTVGETVVIDGQGSFDEDSGDLAGLRFNWRQVSGKNISLLPSATSPAPSFVAAGDGTFEFELVVTDPGGVASEPSRISFVVLALGQDQPKLTLVSSVVSGGPTTSGEDEGDGARAGVPNTLRVLIPATVQLTATLSRAPANQRHRLSWFQVDGPTVLLSRAQDTDTVNAVSQTSFSPTTSRVLVFEATADLLDGTGSPTGVSVRKRIRVIVDSSTSQVPVAVGQSDPRQVPLDGTDKQRTVELDGRQSKGGPTVIQQPRLRYQWRQFAGPLVVISNPAAAVTSFVTPRVGSDSKKRYLFSLFVDTGADRSQPFNVSLDQQGAASTAGATGPCVQLFIGNLALAPATTQLQADGSGLLSNVTIPLGTVDGTTIELDQVDCVTRLGRVALRTYTLQFASGGATSLVLGSFGRLVLDPSIRGATRDAVLVSPASAIGATGAGGGGCRLGAGSGATLDLPVWLVLGGAWLGASRRRRR
ncbi:MAG: hypothetical protein HY303_05705 [Candidatus Wallbacteria bacterium]|nr:hypothetical protein [Candidatus Wallbacteria bacterium]